MTKAYFVIRDEDGNEHVLPPFIVEGKLKTSTAPEKNNVTDTNVELKLKDVDKVLDYLNTHKDIVTSGKGTIVLDIKPKTTTFAVYNSNQE